LVFLGFDMIYFYRYQFGTSYFLYKKKTLDNESHSFKNLNMMVHVFFNIHFYYFFYNVNRLAWL